MNDQPTVSLRTCGSKRSQPICGTISASEGGDWVRMTKETCHRTAGLGRTLFVACFMLVTCLAFSSTLKMQAIYSSETIADLQRTTWHYIPGDWMLLRHRSENLKTYTVLVLRFFKVKPSYTRLVCSAHCYKISFHCKRESVPEFI
jgi:hypothetical protein